MRYFALSDVVAGLPSPGKRKRPVAIRSGRTESKAAASVVTLKSLLLTITSRSRSMSLGSFLSIGLGLLTWLLRESLPMSSRNRTTWPGLSDIF